MAIRNRHGSYASPVNGSVFLYHSLVPLMRPPQAQRQQSYLVPTAVLFHAQTDSWVSAMDEITFAGKNEKGPQSSLLLGLETLYGMWHISTHHFQATCKLNNVTSVWS